MNKVWIITAYKKFLDGHYEYVGYLDNDGEFTDDIYKARYFHDEQVALNYSNTFLSDKENMQFNVENRLVVPKNSTPLPHIKALLQAGIDEGATYFVIRDSEDLVYKGNIVDDAIKEMEGGDEEFSIEFRTSLSTKSLGTFYIFLNGANDIADDLCDYTDNDFCTKVAKKLGLSN